MSFRFNPFTGNFDIDNTAGSAGEAPANATYVVLSTNTTLTNERVLTGTANQVTVTDNGAGSTVVLSLPQDIAETSTPTFADLILSDTGQTLLRTATDGLLLDTLNSYRTSSPNFNSDYNAYRGTSAAPLTVTNDRLIARRKFWGYSGTALRQMGMEEWISGTGTISDSSMPGSFIIYTTPDGSVTVAEALRVNQEQSIIVANDAKAVSFTIGANTLTTAEWANLDGINQTLATTSSPTFNALTATSIIIGANTITTSEWANLDGLNQTVATTSSPTFAGLTIDTDTLFVDSANNRVGIGTVIPDVKLQVEDSSAGAIIDVLQITNTSSTDGSGVGIEFYAANAQFAYIRGSRVSSTDGLLTLGIRDAGSEVDVLHIRDARVGIGTTSPSGILHVYGASGNVQTIVESVSGSYAFHRVKSGTNFWDIAAKDTEFSNSFQFRYNGGTPQVVIETGGNVGIGTTDPNGPLDVQSSDTTTYTVNGLPTNRIQIVNTDTTASNFSGLYFYATSNLGSNLRSGAIGVIHTSHISGSSSGEMFFSTTSGGGFSERMRLTATGLGILNTAPSVALDVTGATKISGDLAVATDSLFVDSAQNHVSVGTATPTLGSGVSGVQTYSDGSVAEFRMTAFRTSTPRALVRGQGAAGTAASPTAIAAADVEYLKIQGEGYHTGDFRRSCEIKFRSGTGTYSATSMPGQIVFATAISTTIDPDEKMRIEADSVVVNDGGLSYDFRVESLDNANMLFVDASANTVGINNPTPTVALDVVGAILASTSIKSASATDGIGYATGAGGTVTQATSKSTGVTLNKVCGNITMNGAALAGDTSVTFVVTNSAAAATDVVYTQHNSAGTLGSYTVTANSMAAGSFSITVRNITTGSLSEAIVIKFVVIKAVTS